MHEVGLVHFFDGIFFFGERSGQGSQADGPAGVLVEQRNHQVAVNFVEAALIDAQHLQGFLGDGAGDAARRAYLRKIARASQ